MRIVVHTRILLRLWCFTGTAEESIPQRGWVIQRTSYGYDANGSQTSVTTQAGAGAPSTIGQKWDFQGHLVARGSIDPATSTWTGSRTAYSYDASGMRQSQSTVAPNGTPEGTVTAATSYLWNGDRLLEERDKDGALLAGYEHGQELGPLRQIRSVTAPGAPAGTPATLQPQHQPDLQPQRLAHRPEHKHQRRRPGHPELELRPERQRAHPRLRDDRAAAERLGL